MATDDKYDRQLRLWGREGQRRLGSARLLVLGSSATATETLKNLVLPGVGSFTIVSVSKRRRRRWGGRRTRQSMKNPGHLAPRRAAAPVSNCATTTHAAVLVDATSTTAAADRDVSSLASFLPILPIFFSSSMFSPPWLVCLPHSSCLAPKVDDAVVGAEDLGNNFFLECRHLGRPRAEAVTELLVEMNPDDCQGAARVASPASIVAEDPGFVTSFTVVVAVQLPQTPLLDLAQVPCGLAAFVAAHLLRALTARCSFLEKHDLLPAPVRSGFVSLSCPALRDLPAVLGSEGAAGCRAQLWATWSPAAAAPGPRSGGVET